MSYVYASSHAPTLSPPPPRTTATNPPTHHPVTVNPAAPASAMQENGGMEDGMATGMVSPNGRGIAMTGTAHSPLNFADDGMDF